MVGEGGAAEGEASKDKASFVMHHLAGPNPPLQVHELKQRLSTWTLCHPSAEVVERMTEVMRMSRQPQVDDNLTTFASRLKDRRIQEDYWKMILERVCIVKRILAHHNLNSSL